MIKVPACQLISDVVKSSATEMLIIAIEFLLIFRPLLSGMYSRRGPFTGAVGAP